MRPVFLSAGALPFFVACRVLILCAAAAALTSCNAVADLFESVHVLCQQRSFNVTTTAEDEPGLLCFPGGSCTLRGALTSVALCGGGRTIRLAGGATYVLTHENVPFPSFRTNEERQDRRVGPVGLPRIVSQVTIEGNGAVLVRNSVRAFRFFHVLSTGDLTVRDLTLQQGAVASGGRGGAVYNEGTFTTEDVSFERNEAPGGDGGALYNAGTATLGTSVLTGNVAGSNGSAIHQEGRSLNLEGATLEANGRADSAGALSVREGAVRIERSAFVYNLGAIAGIDISGGSLDVERSTFYGQQGDTTGALYCVGSGSSSARVSLRDVTIAGNSAVRDFGGGGVRARSRECVLALSNTIVASNTAAGLPRDCRLADTATVRRTGTNLETDGSCDFPLTADPLLGSLTRGGGAPPRLLPARNSPAVDAGGSICLSRDQRGLGRPMGRACDIGAIELRQD